MSLSDDSLDPPNWSKPLGQGLPPFGPPHFRIWPYALGAVLVLAVLGGAGCLGGVSGGAVLLNVVVRPSCARAWPVV